MPLSRNKLTAWAILVSFLALLGYAGRLSGGKPPKDAAYLYSTAASGLVQYAVILAVVLLITRPEWSLLALRRPRDWGRTATGERRRGSRASRALATAFSGSRTAGLCPRARAPMDHPRLKPRGRSPTEKIRDWPLKEN